MDKSKEEAFNVLQHGLAGNRIIIVGGGIIGSALAYHLSHSNTNSQIVLVDSSLSNPQGSTAFAPGFVGQLNTITHLTEMAKRSVVEYEQIPGAFQRIGSLEIVSTDARKGQLEDRNTLSLAAGLQSRILDATEVSKLAPDFVIKSEDVKGRFSPLDGTADSKVITKHYLANAEAKGAILLPLKVTGISLVAVSAGKRIFKVNTKSGDLIADKVVFATGIWTPEIVKPLGLELPIIPVLHPYAYGPKRPPRESRQPFVRWLDRHIYARDHGDCDGWGTYDHEPIPCSPLGSAKMDPTIPRYAYDQGDIFKKLIIDREIIESAMSVFPGSAESESKTPYRSLNAVFALTPDGLPLAGSVPHVPGLYIAAAIWITSAAGVAGLVANIMLDKTLSEGDTKLKNAFCPMRFESQAPEMLKTRALSTYNDIYNKNNH